MYLKEAKGSSDMYLPNYTAPYLKNPYYCISI